MDRIKDFLYYIGDFIICILILSLMYFLITWKLDATMPLDIVSPLKNKNLEVSSDEELSSDTVVIEAGDGDENSLDKSHEDETYQESSDENFTDEQATDGDSADTNEKESSGNTDASDTNSVNQNRTETQTGSSDEITLSISSGMTAVDVAKALKEKTIIDDSNAFIEKIQSMGMSSKLLAGDFKLKKNMDYEQIIRILTRTN